MDDLIQQLADLFAEAGRAHHQAFSEVDGADPEWPIWYAEYLIDRLRTLLDAPLTKSELIHALVHLGRRPSVDWPKEYARYFVERYA
jgi:hypothetical protein